MLGSIFDYLMDLRSFCTNPHSDSGLFVSLLAPRLVLLIEESPLFPLDKTEWVIKVPPNSIVL